MKGIVFVTIHSLNLIYSWINVVIEKVEETKLLGVTLDRKLSWSKMIDLVVAKMGRGLSMIGHCSAFFTSQSTRHALRDLVLSNLDYFPAVWPCAGEDIGHLQLAGNKAARIALRHASQPLLPQSWGENDCISKWSLCGVSKVLNYLFKNVAHSLDTHHMQPEVSSGPGPEQTEKHTVLNRAMTTWNSAIPCKTR